MMNLRPKEKITHSIVEEVFDYEKPDFFNTQKISKEDMFVPELGSQIDL
jgi:hypothetical protein